MVAHMTIHDVISVSDNFASIRPYHPEFKAIVLFKTIRRLKIRHETIPRYISWFGNFIEKYQKRLTINNFHTHGHQGTIIPIPI